MALRRRTLTTALTGLALAGAAGVGAAPAQALTPQQEIAFLNAQRATNGIPAGIVEVPEWSDGCAKHMAYLELNNKFQHEESPSDPGYTAEGEEAGGSSVLSGGGRAFGDDGTNAFEHAPLHLAQMLSPYLERSGASGGCLATLRGLSRTFDAPTTFSYPGPGGTAPVSQQVSEWPFVPQAFVGLSPADDPTVGIVTGPSLYFFYASPDGSGGAITAATLTGPAGPAPVRWVDNTTTGPLGNLGAYLPSGGIVIPVSPLQANASYTATVQFQPSSGAAVSRTWSFATGAAPSPGVPSGTGDESPAGSTTPGAGSNGTATTTKPGPSGGASSSDAGDDAKWLEDDDRVTSFKLRRASLRINTAKRGKLTVHIAREVKSRRDDAKPSSVQRKVKVRFKGKGAVTVPFKALPKGRYQVIVEYADGLNELVGMRTVR